MTAVYSPSQSPWDSERASLRMHAGNPMTPVHSPHHSLASTVSSRTPIHTLTIHEYRKQQNSPSLARKGTPPGKTLRRKPAAFALSDFERTGSVPPSTGSDCGPLQRSLHLSQSAHQLQPNLFSFQQQTQLDLPLRAQTTEPHQQKGSISSLSTSSSSSKVRYFNTRKRLPRPPATTGLVTSTPPNVNVRSAQVRRPRPAPLSLSTEHARLVDAQTTTSSSFSLSQFPNPPHQVSSLLSPLEDERESTHINPPSFAATKPATPPATPAVYHYRGTSFDLVNPHDSLLLHDIITPPRDFDSSDYFLVPSSDDEFPEMAPKRAVYGDLPAAHAGILRRPDDSPGQPCADFPAPPTLSPDSSTYTSPTYSPDIPSPLFAKTPARGPRFNLKNLTRSLTQRLVKGPEKPEEEELRDMRNSNVSTETIRVDMNFPRSLNQPASVPEMPYARVGQMTPMSPTIPTPPASVPAFSTARGHYDTEPLSSMIPDDPPARTEGNNTAQVPYPEGSSSERPYYDELDSLYRSSSIYTGDVHGTSHQYGPTSDAGAGYLADERTTYTLHDYAALYREDCQTPRPHDQERIHGSAQKADSKADTINEGVAEPTSHDTTERASPAIDRRTQAMRDLTLAILEGEVDPPDWDSSEFMEWADSFNQPSSESEEASSRERPTFSRSPGLPPLEPAALLESAWDYEEYLSPSRPDVSSSDLTDSYGDTQDLLQVSHYGNLAQPTRAQILEPSSSYSQPEIASLGSSSSNSQAETLSLNTHRAAVHEAEELHQDTVNQQQNDDQIPAMWSRRMSASQLISRPSEERADWETVEGNSRHSGGTLDSIADYSSSESTRNSLGLESARPLPSWVQRIQSPTPSGQFRHNLGQRSQHTESSSVETQHSTGQESAPAHGAVEQSGALPRAKNPYFLDSKETAELLASGPNDKIIIDEPLVGQSHQSDVHHQHQTQGQTSVSSSAGKGGASSSLTGPQRQNMPEQLPSAGPKATLTGTPTDTRTGTPIGASVRSPVAPSVGTPIASPIGSPIGSPRGTGGRRPGSIAASTIRSAVRQSASSSRQNNRSDYPGFYAAPFPATGSVTRISQPRSNPQSRRGRNLSETSLFPSSKALREAQESSSSSPHGSRQNLPTSTTFVRTHRRTSRSAVHSQTRLREMLLAPDAMSTTSTRTNITHFMGGYRPSTSDTNTPLFTSDPSIGIHPAPSQNTIAHRYSPRLLCVERKSNPEDEARRRQLSWFIFAGFCLLPPCIILFRFFGDDIIASMTEGHLGHCTPQSKRMAVIAGIAVNIILVTAILVPVLVVHATGGA